MSSLVTVYPDPDEQDILTAIRRPEKERRELEERVGGILDAVARRGDDSLKEFARSYDHAEVDRIVTKVGPPQAEGIGVAPELRMAIRRAAVNIAKFHKAQVPAEESLEVEPGVTCWRRVRPIEKVGLYVPGGTAPLFSTVLMLAIPAGIAGCRKIVLATPPQRDGKIHPAVRYAAAVSGVTEIVTAGGAQAIAALAFGTESVEKVDKIFGPGNQYVTKAKEMVTRTGTAIDMPAGPSEVMIAADESADPDFIAADMLSQAEHGPDSQVLVLVDSIALVSPILEALDRQLAALPRREFAEASLSHSSILVVKEKNRLLNCINRYAPEHLILNRIDCRELEEGIVNAGSVFLGPWTPESAGDYASGTNHTLPTNGWARVYSGVSLDSFVKKVTFQSITEQGLKSLGPVIELLAEAESLTAHKDAVTVRLKKIQRKA